MGAHHYKLAIIPTAFSDQSFLNQLIEGEHWTIDVQPPLALLEELRLLLPRNTSWGGTEEFESLAPWGSDIRIWHEDDLDSHVFSIQLRYAAGADSIDLLKRFIYLAKRFHLKLYCESTTRVVEPDLSSVLADFELTGARIFLDDPSSAIVDAAKKLDEPKSGSS